MHLDSVGHAKPTTIAMNCTPYLLNSFSHFKYNRILIYWIFSIILSFNAKCTFIFITIVFFLHSNHSRYEFCSCYRLNRNILKLLFFPLLMVVKQREKDSSCYLLSSWNHAICGDIYFVQIRRICIRSINLRAQATHTHTHTHQCQRLRGKESKNDERKTK